MEDLLLTEGGAARAWALAYNTRDVSMVGPILADDVRVMSRWVVNDMVGRDAYLDYLRRKFLTFDEAGTRVRVELAETPGGGPESVSRPCAVIEQDGSALATVLFDVVGGELFQISIGPHPAPNACVRMGEFPGLDPAAEIIN